MRCKWYSINIAGDEYFVELKIYTLRAYGLFMIHHVLTSIRDYDTSGVNEEQRTSWQGSRGTPIHYLYRYVPPNGVVLLKLLI